MAGAEQADDRNVVLELIHLSTEEQLQRADRGLVDTSQRGPVADGALLLLLLSKFLSLSLSLSQSLSLLSVWRCMKLVRFVRNSGMYPQT